MSAPIYITIYSPLVGNYYHWSLFVQGSVYRIYEVVGQHPSFVYHHLKKDPKLSKHHEENSLVGYVSENDLSTIDQMMSNMNIDNENSGWTCQDWVLEALEELCSEYYLDADNDDYKEGVKRAKEKYFGPF